MAGTGTQGHARNPWACSAFSSGWKLCLHAVCCGIVAAVRDLVGVAVRVRYGNYRHCRRQREQAPGIIRQFGYFLGAVLFCPGILSLGREQDQVEYEMSFSASCVEINMTRRMRRTTVLAVAGHKAEDGQKGMSLSRI